MTQRQAAIPDHPDDDIVVCPDWPDSCVGITMTTREWGVAIAEEEAERAASSAELDERIRRSQYIDPPMWWG